MTAKVIPFNPLERKHLGESVANALLAKDVVPLGGLKSFEGEGIYAIYYTGANPLYARLSAKNQGGVFAQPIYVGKAIPQGARKGGGTAVSTGGKSLHKRLTEHADSIKAVEDYAASPGALKLADFFCRYLIVEDIWIPLGESLMIANFVPVWNKMVDGFGNHNPGKGRHAGKPSRWDILHPGRSWVANLTGTPTATAASITTDVKDFLKTRL